MTSHSFNTSSLRSAHSPLALQSRPEDHAIAHEVLLVAIMKELANITGDSKALLSVRNTCTEILNAAGRPTASAIAMDLITEAQQKI